MPGHAGSLNPQFRVITVKVEDTGALDGATLGGAYYVQEFGAGRPSPLAAAGDPSA